ncbi:MAG: endonuclease VII domain-containing protein [Trichormus sp. ATA11-4-KO1]|jgi:hypothetical protein|nr:endonuclease VII domain-containing protein [Trichormus sp. ATA11-4-KO1]
MSIQSIRKCAKCQVIKPLEDFSTDVNRLSGHRYTCKLCDSERAKCRARRARYGITLYTAVKLWEAQGCKCDVCKDDIPAPGKAKNTVIDHCHTTGVVRGILCTQCNVALGMLKDDPWRIKRLADYIKKP